MKRQKILHILGIILLVLLLAACGSNEDTTDSTEGSSDTTTNTVTDAMGNEVNIPANPQRVIATYLEDNLVALGVKPVAQWSVNDGQSIQDYLQGDLEGIPTVPHDLPFEAVQEMNPDLIIMDSASMVEGGKYEQYNQIAPTYVIGTEVNNDWRDELLRVGEVLGKEDEAKQVLADYETKAQEAKATLEENVGDTSIAAIWLTGGKFFMVSENLSSGAVMYGDLGLTVPAVVKEISASATGNWSEISLEKLAELDAEHLFLINDDGSSDSSPLSSTLWNSIPAVKSGNVYELPKDNSWLYTGAIANGQIIDDILEKLVK